jgi:hypothetical protein
MEDFLDFILLNMDTAGIITAEINKVGRDGLALEDYRGHFYDNQAAMAGVQKRILYLNSLAVVIPCNSHFLSSGTLCKSDMKLQAITNLF